MFAQPRHGCLSILPTGHTYGVPSHPAEPVSDRIVVQQSGPLSGSVTPGGAKNSVLKLIAATLLAPGSYELSNVPGISDVATMAKRWSSVRAAVRTACDRSIGNARMALASRSH